MSGVRVVFRKWGDRPHWEYDAVRLGRDRHGTWLGVAPGTRLSRPGAEFRTAHGFVALVPATAGFVASFYAEGETGQPEGCVEVYVDVTTVPLWQGDTVSMVDLDLDVVRGRSGRVWVDDEDEFADHRVRFGYPAPVVRHATTTCAEVQAAVSGRSAPYDRETGQAWLSLLPPRASVAGSAAP